jgi:4-alpha-glucanotransferase
MPVDPDARRFARCSGVLLHVTSLPGPYGCGDLGEHARYFVDWLQTAGQTLWQFLPLGGLGEGNSPYMSTSAFAGNVLFVDLVDLHQRGWLNADDLLPPKTASAERVDYPRVIAYRMARLQSAASRFAQTASAEDRADFEAFRQRQVHWLGDYALFMALSERAQGLPWNRWDDALAKRRPNALAQARKQLADRVAFWEFAQWSFFRQWAQLRAYARSRGVRLMGDMPIFVSHNSADVWARPDLFQLDNAGNPTVVAGVPPDYFSATGQRWGNPLYRWEAHQAEGFRWWIERLRATFGLVDTVRIDHFRGFESCWEIPADQTKANGGRWAAAPGVALFEALTQALGPLPIIAEDLGVITPEVTALRQRFGLPGMRVLQFAWGENDGGRNLYLPHNYARNTVVYTGTHDNDTTVGWWSTAPEAVRHHVCEYLACDGRDIAWTLMRAASASVADIALFPMQDVLRLDGRHRMNTPGTAEGNWLWRFTWDQVRPEHAAGLSRLGRLYNRVPS